MVSRQKDRKHNKDKCMRAERPMGCDSHWKNKSEERHKQKVRQAESERGRRNYNRQKRQ